MTCCFRGSRVKTDFVGGGTAIAWLHSYLADRQQHVKLGQHSSATFRASPACCRARYLGRCSSRRTCHQSATSSSHMVISYPQFVHDTQLFIAMNTSDTTPVLERLAVCSSAVRLWFLHNGLKLSADKSEVVILDTLGMRGHATTTPAPYVT